MDPKVIRKASRRRAKTLGFHVPRHLPASDLDRTSFRDQGRAVARAAALTVVVSVAFGFDPARGIAWLEENGVKGELTADELRLLSMPKASKSKLARSLETRIEALWALGWALQHMAELDWSQYCGDELARLMPDLEAGEPVTPFKERSCLRPWEEIVEQEDLAYCLHWGVSEALQRNRQVTGAVRGYVIWERRHALSWLLCADEWDEVPLDT